MANDSGQADVRPQQELGSVVDQAFKLVDCVGDEFGNLRKRWNDRIVLERSSLAELYLNGRIEIVIYGKWGIGPNQSDWFCCVAADVPANNSVCADDAVEVVNASDVNSGNEQVVFVVVVEGVKSPQQIASSICRPYLIENKFRGAGEGLLYRLEGLVSAAHFIPRLGYEVLPHFTHRVMDFSAGIAGSGDAGGQMVKSCSQIVDSISNCQRKNFCNWLSRAILAPKLGRFCIGRESVWYESNDIPPLVQGVGHEPQFFNVAVGPLNL